MKSVRKWEELVTKKQIQSEETLVSFQNWDEVKDKASSDPSEVSHCHQAPMIWIGGEQKKEVGICSECRKLAFNNSKIGKLKGNHHQNFVETRFFSPMNQFNYNKGINTKRSKVK